MGGRIYIDEKRSGGGVGGWGLWVVVGVGWNGGGELSSEYNCFTAVLKMGGGIQGCSCRKEELPNHKGTF